jgi:hypothetical protein
MTNLHPLVRAVALGLIAAAFSVAVSLSASAAEVSASHGSDACTSSERWSFSGAIFESKRDDFMASVHGRVAPVRGFSEALAMRRFAQTAEAKTLGEYWISRALYDARLAHIAFGGFVNIASRPVQPSTAGIQISAIECLLQIENRYPSIELPAGVVARITELKAQASTPQMRDVIYQAASSALRAQLPKRGASNVGELMTVLRGAGPYEDFATGLRASHDNDHNGAVVAMDRFLTAPALPPSLKRYINTAHILMARNLYSLRQFDRAAIHLKLITKASNELANALEELAWAQLMSDHLSDAIGTSMTLQAGGLRHTYAPEAPMVMAMALNELCQYPESVRAIHVFRKNYEKAYEWLQKGISGNLYSLAIKYVRKTPNLPVPDRVASEWVRSPLFISSQEELNLLFDEKESTLALGKSGAKEQSKLAEALVIKSKSLPKRLREAKAKMQEGDHLPSLLLADMLALKEMILHYRRLQQGAPVWHTILANYRKTAPATETKLMAGINADLKSRSQRMLAQLEEIAENIQLIEVEIYNGASQDIIWKNAHPDYVKVAQKLKDDRRESVAAKTWDWGRTPANMDEDGAEVWEDELGSFSANLFDNCESKDKYLALRTNR